MVQHHLLEFSVGHQQWNENMIQMTLKQPAHGCQMGQAFQNLRVSWYFHASFLELRENFLNISRGHQSKTAFFQWLGLTGNLLHHLLFPL